MNIEIIHPQAPAMQNNLRVVAYVRESSDNPELENSKENQITFFSNYIRNHAGWEFVDIYCDFGISGFSNKRPAFQRMMKDARKKRFDLIIVKSISRFARNTETTLKATRELRRLGIGVFFYLQNTNTLTVAGELMLTVRAAFAQAESDSASETLKLAYRHRFEKGIPSPRVFETYGYELGVDSQMRIKEPEASVVRMIYNLALEGIHRPKIAEYLNRNGIPSPTGCYWDAKQITRTLRNVTYKGDLLLGKTYLDANRVRRKNRGEADSWYISEDHPAIIPQEEWNQVQEILSQRHTEFYSKKASLSPSVPRSSHSRYPLSGLLHCPYCGGLLIHKWSKTNEFWVCRKVLKEGASTCKGIWLPASVTEGWNLNEPVVAVKYSDEYGRLSYTAYPLDEYDFEEV